jgi:hypothetical protein
LSGLLGALILFLTVVAALVLGIVAAYGLVNGILFTFARQSSPRTSPVLVPSQTPASGD